MRTKSQIATSAIVLASSLTAAVSMPATATTVDLTTAGASGFLNTAFFKQVPDQSTGTGVIKPFLRIQANGTESGFNTDTNNVLDNKDGIWTHSLLLSAIPITQLNNINYYQLLLDINQTGANPLLSLDQLKIFQETSGSQDELSDLSNLVYDMDAGGDNSILLDYSLNPGSGAGDMYAYIPTSLFGGTNPNFVLYSQFGTGSASNDGFEEWAIVGQPTSSSGGPPQELPEPGSVSLALLGLGLLGLGFRTRHKVR